MVLREEEMGLCMEAGMGVDGECLTARDACWHKQGVSRVSYQRIMALTISLA
jgi:hypothetical protein